MPAVDTTQLTSVYLYYDEFDVLLYVGITSRGTKRQREHNSDKTWWPLVKRQEVVHHDTREDALDMERKTIVAQRPPVQHGSQPGPRSAPGQLRSVQRARRPSTARADAARRCRTRSRRWPT